MRILPTLILLLWVCPQTLPAAGLPPSPPDAAAIAALVERPTADCNAADFYMQAQEAYRPELKKPREQRLQLAGDHPALGLILKGWGCRRCEFPYSKDLTLPPWEQTIPMSHLYWSAARTLVARGEPLRQQGRLGEARAASAQAVSLGLHLLQDPGLTFIQRIVALKTLSIGVESLGDLAIAGGQKETAAACERFLAASREYVDGLLRFVREEVPARPLLESPKTQADHLRLVSGYYAGTNDTPVRVEILMYLAFAQSLVDDAGARDAAQATLRRAARDPDPRLAKLAQWGLTFDARTAAGRKALSEMAQQDWKP